MVECRALQKQRHELQLHWAKLQQRELSNLKVCASQSADTVVSSRTTWNQRISLAPCQVKPTSKVECQISAATSGSLGQAIARVKQAQVRQRPFIALLSAPRWLSLTSRALEISGAKAPFGWDFSIRTYNIVSWDAPVMEYARQGEVSKVQKLLADGNASLSDRNEYGQDILDVCLISEQHHRIQLLKTH